MIAKNVSLNTGGRGGGGGGRKNRFTYVLFAYVIIILQMAYCTYFFEDSVIKILKFETLRQ